MSRVVEGMTAMGGIRAGCSVVVGRDSHAGGLMRHNAPDAGVDLYR